MRGRDLGLGGSGREAELALGHCWFLLLPRVWELRGPWEPWAVPLASSGGASGAASS